MGPFGVNGKDDRGDVQRVPVNDHGEESKEIRRCDMEDTKGSWHTRGSGNPVG